MYSPAHYTCFFILPLTHYRHRVAPLISSSHIQSLTPEHQHHLQAAIGTKLPLNVLCMLFLYRLLSSGIPHQQNLLTSMFLLMKLVPSTFSCCPFLLGGFSFMVSSLFPSLLQLSVRFEVPFVLAGLSPAKRSMQFITK